MWSRMANRKEENRQLPALKLWCIKMDANAHYGRSWRGKFHLAHELPCPCRIPTTGITLLFRKLAPHAWARWNLPLHGSRHTLKC